MNEGMLRQDGRGEVCLMKSEYGMGLLPAIILAKWTSQVVNVCHRIRRTS